MSDVTKITKGEKSRTTAYGDNFRFGVDVGYMATKGSGSIPVDISVSKRIVEYLYGGISVGTFIPTKGADLQIPVTGDFKLLFPLNSSSLIVGGDIRFGYVFNTAGDIKVGGETYESPDFIMLQAMPTIELPLSPKTNFLLGVGYTHAFATSGSAGGAGYFSVKTGLRFHNAQGVEPKPKKPTYDEGFQLTFNGGVSIGHDEESIGLGLGLGVTYKVSPKISFGVGGSFEEFNYFRTINSVTFRGNKKKEEYYSADALGTGITFYIRGRYRFINKRLSPFANMDIGGMLLQYSDWRAGVPEPRGNNVFVSPSLGLSLRTGSNTYLELQAGYRWCPKTTETQNYTYEYATENVTVKTDMSRVFINFGITHTFKWKLNLSRKQSEQTESVREKKSIKWGDFKLFSKKGQE